MNLNVFMKDGINRIMKTVGRFYLQSPKGLAFLSGALPQMKKSAKLREENEAAGTHVPAFLIASVASQCNLHCSGCYTRASGGCDGDGCEPDLSGEEWTRVFDEADSLGVSFVLLAGGEPLMRRDVLDAAAAHPRLVFPVFTNGTLIDGDYLALFDNRRNLIPVLSIEGDEAGTDARRGKGVHAAVEGAMAALREKGVLFGASVTVTSENMDEVVREDFLAGLAKKGCGIVFYVEYVPIEAGTEYLALDDAGLAELNERTDALKAAFPSMAVLSFPGDEAAMGGCLASGRGFFHVNSKGGAEPCPFSPHAKYNLRNASMAKVLRSGYFEDLRAIAAEAGPHTGGCVLFQREAEVLALVNA